MRSGLQSYSQPRWHVWAVGLAACALVGVVPLSLQATDAELCPGIFTQEEILASERQTIQTILESNLPAEAKLSQLRTLLRANASPKRVEALLGTPLARGPNGNGTDIYPNGLNVTYTESGITFSLRARGFMEEGEVLFTF